jgi:hypothetical protein
VGEASESVPNVTRDEGEYHHSLTVEEESAMMPAGVSEGKRQIWAPRQGRCKSRLSGTQSEKASSPRVKCYQETGSIARCCLDGHHDDRGRDRGQDARERDADGLLETLRRPSTRGDNEDVDPSLCDRKKGRLEDGKAKAVDNDIANCGSLNGQRDVASAAGGSFEQAPYPPVGVVFRIYTGKLFSTCSV